MSIPVFENVGIESFVNVLCEQNQLYKIIYLAS